MQPSDKEQAESEEMHRRADMRCFPESQRGGSNVTIHPACDDLTKRQYKIWLWIRTCQERDQFTPTIREICQHFGYSSPNAAQSHLRALERKGYIRREAFGGAIVRGNKGHGLTGLRVRCRETSIPVMGVYQC